MLESDLGYSLGNKVRPMLVLGAAVLKISKVLRGHEGVYRCVTASSGGKRSFNSITVKVIHNGKYHYS